MNNEVKVHYYEGDDHLKLNGKELQFTMMQFWQMKLSTITETMTRGSFAEFLVACALAKYSGIDAFHQNKIGTEAWDLDGPKIVTDGGECRQSKIEVKTTASVNIKTPDEKEPVSLKPTRLTFSIREAMDWDHPELGKRRHSDIYVFCHYKATRKEDDPLDLELWDFYVMATWRINADENLKKQGSISVWKLQSMGFQPVAFEGLYDAIADELKTVK